MDDIQQENAPKKKVTVQVTLVWLPLVGEKVVAVSFGEQMRGLSIAEAIALRDALLALNLDAG